MCTLNVLSPTWWPAFSFSTMSGSPAAARKRRQPVVVLDDLVRDGAGRDLAGPADHLRDAERALPVGVLLAAERRHAGVGPGVHVRAVVGAVDDDRVRPRCRARRACRAVSDVLVVVDHRVVVGRLPAARLPDALRLGVRAEVHVSGVEPDEERRVRRRLAIDEVDRVLEHLVVDRLHPLLRQRPRCPRCAACRRGPNGARSVGSSSSVAHECSTPRGPKRSLEVREVLRRRIVRRARAPPRR